MAGKLLIVDNDASLITQLTEAFSKRGYEVATAPDGMEALARCRDFHPQVIILDLLLPKIDGYRFCRYLREDLEFINTPVFVLSALAMEESERIRQFGIQGIFQKEKLSELIPKLTDAVESALHRKRPSGDDSAGKITSRREILRELLEQRAHFLDVLNLLPDGMLELDNSNRIIFANTAVCRILERTEASLIGQNAFELLPGLDGGPPTPLTGKSQRASAQTLTWKDRTFNCVTTTLPTGTLILLTDVSREQSQAETLEKQNHEIESLGQELERRLRAIRLIRDLSTEIEYPYGYREVVQAILRILPALIPCNASAAMMQDGESWVLHVRTNQDPGEANINWIRIHMVDRYRELTGDLVDQSRLTFHFSGASSPIAARAESGHYQDLLMIPLKMNDRLVGIAGCFSFSHSAFSKLDEVLLDHIANLTSNSVVNFKNLVDTERQKIRSMVESMVDGVLMTDENDEIVVINQAARKMLHVSRKGDHLSRKYLQDTLGFYPFHLTKGFSQQSGGPRAVREEMKLYDKTFHSVVAPVFDSKNEPIGTVVVLRDITEQKESEERKDDFFSLVSHELRTPLASIGGSIDLVLKNVVGMINEKQRRYLELAHDSCEKLNLVIDDLLDLSKFEKGKMDIYLESISLLHLIEEVTEKFQASAMEKQIILKLQKPEFDITIFGDYNRLVQVMNNLLSNALKFTSSGGLVEVEIFVPQITPPHIGVSVRDTGPGIRAEDLERVFDKFEQVRRSELRKIGGTGLGLAISRNIIEAHRGKIWAESKPGEGARFIFVLPVEKRAVPTAAIETSLEQVESEEIQVLIIADDPAAAYMMKGLMLERKWKLTSTQDPEEGLQFARQQTPNLIILDLESTKLSSEQFAEILTHDPETSGIPIITFQPLPGISDNIFQADKPIDINQFAHTISQALLSTKQSKKQKRILLVDDDANLRMIFREALQFERYKVIEASDGSHALELLKRERPDVILLDIMLPGIDGIKIAEIIKSNVSTSQIPIIFLTAKGQTEDKVKALKTGADDYLVKPVDSSELVARIEAILDRTEAELATSPTTKLPGSVTIEKEISRLLSQQKRFALCYLDLDNLKAFNDVYGYAKADGVVKQTGDLIRETVQKLGEPGDFVGHIAGDDFVIITQPELADRICLNIIQRFDQIIPYFYKKQDREKGFIEAEDRYGAWRQFRIMSISIACLTNEDQRFGDHVQIATLAAELKRSAKAIPGSVYVRNGKVVRPQSV